MTDDERKALEAELREADAKIDAAYWRFCRCAAAKPPVMVVPEAYQTRARVRALLGLRP